MAISEVTKQTHLFNNYNMQGTKPFSLNLKELWQAIKNSAAYFVPVFFLLLLENMGELQEIFIAWLGSFGLPHWSMLILVPAATAICFVVVEFLKDNSKK